MTVRSLNLVESVYADLRQRLQHSEISPDQRLIDTEIAGHYGTSRMPAREALLRLVVEGYLVGTTRGFVIPALTREDIRELCELRRLLEPRAAAAAARDMTDAGMAILTEAMETIRQGDRDDDHALIVRANVRFRNAWVACVRNRRLATTIARNIDYFQALRIETFIDPVIRETYLVGLEALYGAFVSRDPLAAEDRMLAFLFTAEAAYLRALDKVEARTPQNKRRQRAGTTRKDG